MADSTTHEPTLHQPAVATLDDDAWLRELVHGHAAVVRRFAASQVGPDAADDVVSETFAAAWRNRDSFDPSLSSERAWLVGIALNRCRMLARTQRRWRRRAERVVPDRVDIGFAADADARLDASRSGREVLNALDKLTTDQRTVLVLVAYAGLTSTEVAAAMSIPAATVRSHLSRARRAVAITLSIEDSDHD